MHSNSKWLDKLKKQPNHWLDKLKKQQPKGIPDKHEFGIPSKVTRRANKTMELLESTEPDGKSEFDHKGDPIMPTSSDSDRSRGSSDHSRASGRVDRVTFADDVDDVDDVGRRTGETGDVDGHGGLRDELIAANENVLTLQERIAELEKESTLGLPVAQRAELEREIATLKDHLDLANEQYEKEAKDYIQKAHEKEIQLRADAEKVKEKLESDLRLSEGMLKTTRTERDTAAKSLKELQTEHLKQSEKLKETNNITEQWIRHAEALQARIKQLEEEKSLPSAITAWSASASPSKGSSVTTAPVAAATTTSTPVKVATTNPLAVSQAPPVTRSTAAATPGHVLLPGVSLGPSKRTPDTT